MTQHVRAIRHAIVFDDSRRAFTIFVSHDLVGRGQTDIALVL
jgi:hypothetical protein